MSGRWKQRPQPKRNGPSFAMLAHRGKQAGTVRTPSLKEPGVVFIMAHPRPESPHAPTVAASQWLSIDESGHYSGLSGRTLRRYVAEGVLPAYRVAGRRQLRFKRSDLDALMVPVPTVGGADV